MSFYRGMTCKNVTISGADGTPITAYVARSEGAGPFPGVVLIHHLPGWSEFYIETTRRFAHHGYLAACRTERFRDWVSGVFVHAYREEYPIPAHVALRFCRACAWGPASGLYL